MLICFTTTLWSEDLSYRRDDGVLVGIFGQAEPPEKEFHPSLIVEYFVIIPINIKQTEEIKPIIL